MAILLRKYDAFISYVRREDETRAHETAQILESAGLRVFWDRDIPPGDPWEATIEHAIAKSKRFFVLWCCGAANSRFVAQEIKSAQAHGKPVVAHRICPFPVPDDISKLQWVDRIDPTHPCDCTHDAAPPPTALINGLINRELRSDTWAEPNSIDGTLRDLLTNANRRGQRSASIILAVGYLLVALVAVRPIPVDLPESTIAVFDSLVGIVGLIMTVSAVLRFRSLRKSQRRILHRTDSATQQSDFSSKAVAASILAIIQLTEREGWEALREYDASSGTR